MGCHVSIQHVESKLFLDCSGADTRSTLILSPESRESKGRLQCFILAWGSGGTCIRTDQHNRKLRVIEGGTVRLNRHTSTPFELITIRENDNVYTQVKSAHGYLQGSAATHSVSVVPSGRSRLTLWKIIPRDAPSKKPKKNCPLQSALSTDLHATRYGPFTPANEQAHVRDLEGTWQFGSLNTSSEIYDDDGEEDDAIETRDAQQLTDAFSVVRVVSDVWSWLSQSYDETEASPSRSLVRRHSQGRALSDVTTNLPTSALSRPTNSEPPVTAAPDRIVLIKTCVVSDLAPGVVNVSPHKPGVVEQFELQEGVTQLETLYFKVTKGRVVNLLRRMTTFKMSFQVDRRDEPMGTFDDSKAEHSFTFPSTPVPSGWHVRGQYRCIVEFIDDAGLCCPAVEKQFAIVKRKS